MRLRQPGPNLLEDIDRSQVDIFRILAVAKTAFGTTTTVLLIVRMRVVRRLISSTDHVTLPQTHI